MPGWGGEEKRDRSNLRTTLTTAAGGGEGPNVVKPFLEGHRLGREFKKGLLTAEKNFYPRKKKKKGEEPGGCRELAARARQMAAETRETKDRGLAESVSTLGEKGKGPRLRKGGSVLLTANEEMRCPRRSATSLPYNLSRGKRRG